MTLALRWMGNLVTDEDRDRAARVWRWAGRRSVRLDERPPFSLTSRAAAQGAGTFAGASASWEARLPEAEGRGAAGRR